MASSDFDSKRFAQDWESAWNSHDIDAIISHYTDDVIFQSTKALAFTGSSKVVGKCALKSYWQKALDKQKELKFQVLEVLDGADMLVLIYSNQNDVLAAETLYFDDNKMIYQASACHKTPKGGISTLEDE